MKKTKILLLTVSAVALMAATALGTAAYLTSRDSVQNTFTVGAVGLTLDEAAVNPDGTYKTDAANRVQKNVYHLLPGHTYIKDPTVTVDKESAESYVRMVVRVEKLQDLQQALPEEAYYKDLNGDGKADILLDLLLEDSWNDRAWHFAGFREESDGNTGVYEFRYYTKVDASQEREDVTLEPLFQKIKVPATVDNARLEKLRDVQIHIYAHAIQADGFETAEEAWLAFGA